MYLTITLFIIVAVFLILLILIQKGRGGGLASAFGGAGGNTAFGSKTGDVLTWATSIVFGIFLLLSITLNLLAKSQSGDDTSAPNPTAERTGVPNSPQVPPAAGDPGVNPDVVPPTGPEKAPTQSGNVAPAAAAAPSTQPNK
jgi:preprotein translocase subunit SecG